MWRLKLEAGEENRMQSEWGCWVGRMVFERNKGVSWKKAVGFIAGMTTAKCDVQPRVDYAYSYQGPNTRPFNERSFIIKFKCPVISSINWCLKLYSLVLGGLGLLLSFIWVCFHLYVLSHTNLQELRHLRWFHVARVDSLWWSKLSIIVN